MCVMCMSLFCRFAGPLQRLFGTNTSNAYRPLPTDETPTAGNIQQSNNFVDNTNQSSAVVSPRSPRRRHVFKSPTTQVPTLHTIPEEHGEEGAVANDDPGANSNTNNSSLLPTVADAGKNVNNSAGSFARDFALVRLQDAIPSLSPPPLMTSREALPRSMNRLSDNGFVAVDLFAA